VNKVTEGIGSGKPGPGRPKGAQNKLTRALKDMILTALDEAHEGGGIAYLKDQAKANPTAFLTLVGKVLPLQVAGDPDHPLIHEIRRTVVRP
jgi:hypothetical protein